MAWFGFKDGTARVGLLDLMLGSNFWYRGLKWFQKSRGVGKWGRNRKMGLCLDQLSVIGLLEGKDAARSWNGWVGSNS